MKQFKTSLFIFRRDLRLEDNRGLLFALEASEEVIPAFIFTPTQIEKNSYRSDHCLKFMLESLQELDESLHHKNSRLYLFHGEPDEVLKKCIRHLSIQALIVNRDYTPYSRKRDKLLEETCKEHNLAFHAVDDALLHPPEKTVKKDGKPYTIFTPYFKHASTVLVTAPLPNRRNNYFREPIAFAEKRSYLTQEIPKVQTTLQGGRKNALKILHTLSSFQDYEKKRDFPAESYSTHLSPYLKFTLCSPREIFTAIAQNLNGHHPLIRSLHWRDFFTAIAFFFPHVFKGAFHSEYDQIEWSYDRKIFQRWCDGETGVPIVDAGMRELNQTGFMHNRVRMIAASFLIKDLHIDWRWGEKYFAQTLIDYDPAVNNGNWQWVASTGCDAQPYFRIFNPWNQQKRFDAEAQYIKQWVPELKEVPVNILHRWYESQYHQEYPNYPPPLADHTKEAKVAFKAYQKSRHKR